MSKQNNKNKTSEVKQHEGYDPGRNIPEVVDTQAGEVFDAPLSDSPVSDVQAADVADKAPDTEIPASAEESEMEDEENIDPNEKFEVSLKLARKHVNDAFRIGSVVVAGYVFKKYLLNHAEIEELVSDGPAHWIECEDVDLKEELKKKKQSKFAV